MYSCFRNLSLTFSLFNCVKYKVHLNQSKNGYRAPSSNLKYCYQIKSIFSSANISLCANPTKWSNTLKRVVLCNLLIFN